MQPADQGGTLPSPLGLIQKESLSSLMLRTVTRRVLLSSSVDGFLPRRRYWGIGTVDGLDEVVDIVGNRDDAGAVDHPVQCGRAHEHVLLAVDHLGPRFQRGLGGRRRRQAVDVAGGLGKSGRPPPLVTV